MTIQLKIIAALLATAISLSSLVTYFITKTVVVSSCGALEEEAKLRAVQRENTKKVLNSPSGVIVGDEEYY